MSKTLLGGAAVVALMWALPASAQVRIPEGASVKFSGRVHSQFNSTSVADESSTEFLIRRARLSAEVKLNDYITGKVEPDFGEGEITLKDAWLRLTVAPEFRATIGQFKRPFDLFELTSSSQILVVERAGGIRGVSACSGPGGACTFSRLTEKLQFADRDIGLLVNGDLADGRVSYAASVTNGTGANAEDENGNKSFTGRLSVEVANDVTLGGNVARHDYIHPTSTANDFAMAFGGDLQIGNFSRGIHLQAGVVAGENWRNPVGATDVSNFLTAQGILTYRSPIVAGPLTGVEPVLRLSWADPDTDTDDDQGILITPGIMFHFLGRNKLGANVDIWSPGVGDTEYSFKVQSFFYF